MSTPLYTAATTLYTEMKIVLKWHLSQTCITQANRGVFMITLRTVSALQCVGRGHNMSIWFSKSQLPIIHCTTTEDIC